MTGNPTEAISIQCPYCGERLEIVVDCSAGDQNYVEDCQVCCQPMELAVTLDETGFPTVAVAREDEA